MSAQWERVARLLGHPCETAHRDDAEWVGDSTTAYCAQTGCLRRLCGACASVNEGIVDGYARLYCQEHA